MGSESGSATLFFLLFLFSSPENVQILDTLLQRASKTNTFTSKTQPCQLLYMENGTILIVDDNKSVLASIELLLESEFSKVRTASNPNQISSLLTTQSVGCGDSRYELLGRNQYRQ